MIGQSAIGNPRILTPHLPTLEQRFSLIFHHLDLMMASERLFHEARTTMDQQLIMPTYEQLCIISQQKPWTQKPESTSRVAFEFRKYLFNYLSGFEGNKAIKQQIPERKDYSTLIYGLQIYADTLLKQHRYTVH